MKKNLLKIGIILLFILGLYLLFPKGSFAASAVLNSLNFDVKINEEGDMTVIEDWDITLKNARSIYKSFKKDMSKYYGVTGIQVYDLSNGSQTPLSKGNGSIEGYYDIKEIGDLTEVEWGTGTAGKTVRKKYRLAYYVKDIITQYNDCAELYWQFLGEDFSIPAKKITGTITLPDGIEKKSEIRAWGHINSMTGSIKIKNAHTVTFNITRYSANQFLEVRLLLPANAITNSNRYENIAMKDNIIKEEQGFANSSNIYRAFNTILLIALIILFVYIFYYEIRKLKKLKAKLDERKTYNSKYIYYREIPNKDSSPGRAVFLLNSKLEVEHGDFNKVFAATILDLKNKGYFDIKEKPGKEKNISYIELSEDMMKYKAKRKYRIDHIENLSEDENLILDYVVDLTNEAGILPLQDISGHINYNEKNKMEFVELASSVYNKIEVIETLNGNIKRKNNIKNKHMNNEYSWEIMVQIGILLLIVGLTWFFLNLIFMIEIILPIINLIFIWRIKKVTYYLTEKGLEESSKWSGLKKFLEEYSLLNEKKIRDLGLWEEYLIYATAFGISEKIIKEIKTEIEHKNDEDDTDNSRWSDDLEHEVRIWDDLTFNMNFDFAQMLSELYLNSSFDLASSSSLFRSSGSGFGGGFSRGGGGGAGGGGGGVR